MLVYDPYKNMKKFGRKTCWMTKYREMTILEYIINKQSMRILTGLIWYKRWSNADSNTWNPTEPRFLPSKLLVRKEQLHANICFEISRN